MGEHNNKLCEWRNKIQSLQDTMIDLPKQPFGYFVKRLCIALSHDSTYTYAESGSQRKRQTRAHGIYQSLEQDPLLLLVVILAFDLTDFSSLTKYDFECIKRHLIDTTWERPLAISFTANTQVRLRGWAKEQYAVRESSTGSCQGLLSILIHGLFGESGLNSSLPELNSIYAKLSKSAGRLRFDNEPLVDSLRRADLHLLDDLQYNTDLQAVWASSYPLSQVGVGTQDLRRLHLCFDY